MEQLCPALAQVGIIFSSYSELDEEDVKALDEVFEERIFPVLTPLAVDPSHPFPYISHLSLNLAVLVRDPVTAQRRFARVKVPPLLPRFLVLPDGERFVPLEQVIGAHLPQLFPGMEVVDDYASASPATPTSPSKRKRPTTCSPPSSSSCAAVASAAPFAWSSMPTPPMWCATFFSESSTSRTTTST